MANTTLSVAANSTVSQKLVAACAGPAGIPGASIKAFTATAGTGNYPIAGLTLNLAALFPTKVLAVVITGLYDPAVASADLLFPAIYVPAASNAPATGKVYMYCSNGAANAGLLMVPNDTVDITGYVVTGFAIGY